jgi:hypothetical protein
MYYSYFSLPLTLLKSHHNYMCLLTISSDTNTYVFAHTVKNLITYLVFHLQHNAKCSHCLQFDLLNYAQE